LATESSGKFYGLGPNPILVQSAISYTVLPGETLIGITNTDSARTVTLPALTDVEVGARITIKDGSGLAATNNITISPSGGKVPDTDLLLWQQVAAGSDLGTVVAATAAALATCTASGSGVGKTLTATANGALSIDGVSPTAAQAVLVKDQADAKDNGLYTVTATGDGSNPFVLTRKTTFDAVSEVLPGSVASISAGGTVNGSTKWALRGGIDGAKTLVISTAWGVKTMYSTGQDWRVV
jgi:hypothetical protein